MKADDPGSGLEANPAGGNGGNGGGASWNEAEFDEINAQKQKDPEVWSEYQKYYQDQLENMSETETCKFDVDFDYDLDQNGKPILKVDMPDGTIRRIPFEKTRDKYYHEDIFPNIKPPEGFNNKEVRKLSLKDQRNYLRNNIPDEYVIKLQNEIAKSFKDPNIKSVPGSIGKRKERITLDINPITGIVSCTDAGTDNYRTIVKMKPQQIKKLAENDFNIFPNK